MKKAVLKYGLISGGISALLMMCTMPFIDKIGFDNGYLIGYSAIILSLLAIYFGMAYYRDKVGGGQIKYGRALAIGLLITTISSICYVIAWSFVYHFIFPDFMDKYGAYMIETMKKKNLPTDEIAKQTEGLKQMKELYKNPVMFVLFTFIEPFPVGVGISIISAFIVRMKKKPATTN
jgi:uncharacterized protein DUF4199